MRSLWAKTQTAACEAVTYGQGQCATQCGRCADRFPEVWTPVVDVLEYYEKPEVGRVTLVKTLAGPRLIPLDLMQVREEARS